MTTTSLPTLSEVDLALAPLQALAEGSEMHGVMCALICLSAREPATPWQKLLLEMIDAALPPEKCTETLLQELHTITEQLLKDSDLTFTLLLPTDEESMTARLAALGKWCEGFIGGLGLAEIGQKTKVSPEMTEVLNDLRDIALIDNTTPEDEENEEAYMELVEYVRMAVILIYNEFLSSCQNNNNSNKYLH